MTTIIQEDKALVQAIREEADRRNIRGLERWRLERRLSQPAFVTAVSQEIKSQVFWDNPGVFNSKDPAGIDWSSIDWDKVFSIVLQLLTLFM